MSLISNYTLRQFRMFLDAAEDNEAGERAAFVTDMSVVVGGLFSKESVSEDHMTLLLHTASGVRYDGEP